MFGMGGSISGGKQFGMGLVLGMKNDIHGTVQSAIRDFESLHGSASALDKKMIASGVRWNKSMDLMASATKDFMRVGAIAAGIGFLGSMGKETEQAYADLRSLRTKGMEGIEADMRKMLLKEKLPIPFKDAISELYNLKSAGVKDTDLTSGMKSIGTTALATMGTIADAMEAYTNTYSLFFDKMGGSLEKKNQRFSDVFSSSVMQYKTKLPQLNEQFAKTANRAAMLGLSIEQTVPALGTLLTAGMGERTGEAFRSMLDNIGTAGKKLGMKFVDAKGNMLPLLTIVDKLKKKFGDTLTVKEAQKIREAFGDVGSAGVMTLMSLRDRYAEGIKAASEYGISQEMAKERADTLNYKFVTLKNSLGDLGDQFSKSAGMREWTDSMTNMINAASEFIKQNPMVAKTIFKLAEAMALYYGGKGVAKAGRGIWGAGSAIVTGAGAIIGKVKTGTWQPWKWFPKMGGSGAEAAAQGMASKTAATSAVDLGAAMGAKHFAEVQAAKQVGLRGMLGNILGLTTPVGWIANLAMMGTATQPEASRAANKTRLAENQSYFRQAEQTYLPPSQSSDYHDNRSLKIEITIDGNKADAELLNDDQIDRITRKFQDSFFINPLRDGRMPEMQ